MVPIGLRVQRFATTAMPAYLSREGGIVTRADLQDVIARALPDSALGLHREVEAGKTKRTPRCSGSQTAGQNRPPT